jgi:NAD(P)-dependent dehydrogenase (short-subunit alcohol dehydrogenase family)
MSVVNAVVISGASTGIGAATGLLLAQRGYLVFAGVRTAADAERIEAAHANIRALHLDVTDLPSISAAAQIVRASGARLAGLVNNAGIAVAGPLEIVNIDELRMQFEVNVLGQIAVTQAFLPQLREDRGRIVFVGSVSGRFTLPLLAPYSASKFALRALADGLRAELAPNIFVSLIEPGSVRTPIWRKGRDNYAGRRSNLPARYQGAMDAMLQLSEREERTGISPDRVTRVIAHALFSPKPRANYLVGERARLGAAIVPLLPTSLRDRIFRKAVRLDESK